MQFCFFFHIIRHILLLSAYMLLASGYLCIINAHSLAQFACRCIKLQSFITHLLLLGMAIYFVYNRVCYHTQAMSVKQHVSIVVLTCVASN